MTRQEVKKAFPKAKEEGKFGMALLMPVVSKKATVSFLFTPNRLAVVGVLFNARHLVAEAYLQEFEDLKSTLTKKYGAPIKDTVKWHNKSLFHDNPDHLGTAVQLGHASMMTEWVTGETTIRLTCESDQGTPKVQILYASTRLIMEFMKMQQEAEGAEL
jgi:hypothetical protein